MSEIKKGITGAAVCLLIASILLVPSALADGNGGGTGDQKTIENVPYVWQRRDGFCVYASISSIFQHYGRDISLERALNVSGAGWGAGRLKSSSNWLFFSGPVFNQSVDISYLSNVYGMKTTFWYSAAEASSSLLSTVSNLSNNLDIETRDIGEWSGARRALKGEIDNGNPVLLALDPYYLPHKQYLSLPRETLMLPRHSVVAYGYSENGIKVMDPFVGGIGEEHGKPSRDEGTYKVSHENLRRSWSAAGFRGFVFSPVGEKKDIERLVEDRVTAKLLPIENLIGVYTAKDIPSNVRYSYAFGYKAFEELSTDLKPENFKSMLQSWQNRYHENLEYISSLMSSARKSLVKAMTLTRYSYLLSLSDLKNFVENDSKAIDHFENALNCFGPISDRYTLLYPNGKRSENTVIDRAFSAIIENLKNGGTIDAAISDAKPHLNDLSIVFGSISSNLKEGYDSMKSMKSPPVADAGGPYRVEGGSKIGLDGDLSEDPDGKIDRYNWTIVDDPTEEAKIKNKDSRNPVFVAPDVRQNLNVVIQLIVVDDDGFSSSDNQIVEIKISEDSGEEGLPVEGIFLGVIGVASLSALVFWLRKRRA